MDSRPVEATEVTIRLEPVADSGSNGLPIGPSLAVRLGFGHASTRGSTAAVHGRLHGALDALGTLLDEARVPARRFVVSSPLVWRLHGARLAARCRRPSRSSSPTASESKQLQTVARVYDALVRANADRASTLITFGGGVIGDMAGFAAATYLRGIALVHVPTTLLAQVDSAIGGKVGVNHPLGKNLIGSFYQPHAVVVDPSVLATLPRREFRAGLYEVIKYGMTSSPSLFDRIARERDRDLRARSRRR